MGDTYLSSGDMLVIITAVAAIAVSVWALMVGMALLFSKRSLMARASLEEAPWRAFFIGLPSAAAALFFGVGFFANPNPIVKLIGAGVQAIFRRRDRHPISVTAPQGGEVV